MTTHHGNVYDGATCGSMSEAELHGVIPKAEGELATLRLFAFIARILGQQPPHQPGVLANTHVEVCDHPQNGVITDWGACLLGIPHFCWFAHLQRTLLSSAILFCGYTYVTFAPTRCHVICRQHRDTIELVRLPTCKTQSCHPPFYSTGQVCH